MTPLTPREMEVMRLTANGWTWREAIHRMGVTRGTYWDHRKAAYAKLGAECREDAYRALGWLQVPS